MKKFIFGTGSGRCGTGSLARVIQVNNIYTSHEAFFIPWEIDKEASFKGLAIMYYNKSEAVCDVAFYWINYVDQIRKYVPNPKIICLKRDRDEVVESWMNFQQGKNYWTSPASEHWGNEGDVFDQKIRMFPKYDLPKREAIAAYWEEFYRIAEYWQAKYPNVFKIFSMESVLNTEDGQRGMFEFAEIKNPIITLDIKYHELKKD